MNSRFAPSPTGALHLGHAYSALMAHDAARDAGGAFRLRIDDLDAGRVRPAFRVGIDADLAWLGLVPDGPAVVQSDRTGAYAGALERLRAGGLLYPCFCTRADIAASIAAPHGADGPRYPGTCRGLVADERIARGDAHALRLDVAAALALSGPLAFSDAEAGLIAADPAMHGDVVLARRDGTVAYHLASTIDDAAMAITLVVRGRDLLSATHIHRLLQALLDLPVPAYRHHRLIGGADGRRLAKRDGAATLASMRAAGVDPRALIAQLRLGNLPPGYRWL